MSRHSNLLRILRKDLPRAWLVLVAVSLAAVAGCSAPQPSGPELSIVEQPLDFDLPPIELALSGTEATLGPGDTVAINVYRHPEFNQTVAISPIGTLFVPLAGEIEVVGTRATDLRATITSALDRYIVNPQVNVTVTLRGSQKVMLLGEVGRPGVFTIQTSASVLELVTRAGGFTLAGEQSKVLLHRREGDQVVQHVLDLKAVVRDGQLTHNLLVKRGDIIYVPATWMAETDRFAAHISRWLTPVLQVQSGILLGHDINDRFGNETTIDTTTNVFFVP